ncbi:MAG: sensor histidine kinase [Acetivibrionales bacterium]
MKKKTRILYLLLRDTTMAMTFVLAINMENAANSRLLSIIVLFTLLVIWMHIREIIFEKYSRLAPCSFMIDCIILILLDFSSKYVVNYYFNIYYFYVLIAAGFILKHRHRLVVSFAIIAAALVKYLRFMDTYNTSFVFSYLFFMLMVFITLAVFLNYSKMLSEEKAKLDKLNSELKRVNKEMEEKNNKIKGLTIIEERNRIAREIHDSVGHGLTGLIINLDFCDKIVEKNNLKLKNQLSKSRDIAKECLLEIRKAVQTLKPPGFQHIQLIKSLEEIALSSKDRFSIEVVLNVSGSVYITRPDFNITLYRVVQEAVTNSVRHGNANNVKIEIDFGNSSLSVLIKDDGKGAKSFRKGNGLNGIKERMRVFGGDVSFFGDNGFMINIEVPKEMVE